MEQVSRKLTIFEGCDGSGKSTAAKAFAQATGAKYVHFDALPRVNVGLARMCVEAMLPALLGYQDVVFDRCWLSERPYGIVFREGRDRLGYASRRMLERLAMRCGAVLVRCNPGWEAVKQSYMSRKHLEMLDDVDQLKQVFELYEQEPTDLPEVHHDYTINCDDLLYGAIESARFECHQLNVASVGNWRANTILIGKSFYERGDAGTFHQWPFISFGKKDPNQWLARQLGSIEYGEADLLWVDSDQDLSFIHLLKPSRVIALGNSACDQLHKLGIAAQTVRHPNDLGCLNERTRYALTYLLAD